MNQLSEWYRSQVRLERSRQSARECRARKKLRYQYLEELVKQREKAVIVLRDEFAKVSLNLNFLVLHRDSVQSQQPSIQPSPSFPVASSRWSTTPKTHSNALSNNFLFFAVPGDVPYARERNVHPGNRHAPKRSNWNGQILDQRCIDKWSGPPHLTQCSDSRELRVVVHKVCS